jgi:uncharacterized lipoprotein YehR (DUF1307 family)
VNILGLIIAGSLLVIVIVLFVATICDGNKEKKKYKKDVEELKVGNRYKTKKFRWVDDNPFKVEPTFIVEITDIKNNNKNEVYVQYKQIEPEYKGEPFSEPFKDFIDFFDLIK